MPRSIPTLLRLARGHTIHLQRQGPQRGLPGARCRLHLCQLRHRKTPKARSRPCERWAFAALNVHDTAQAGGHSVSRRARRHRTRDQCGEHDRQPRRIPHRLQHRLHRRCSRSRRSGLASRSAPCAAGCRRRPPVPSPGVHGRRVQGITVFNRTAGPWRGDGARTSGWHLGRPRCVRSRRLRRRGERHRCRFSGARREPALPPSQLAAHLFVMDAAFISGAHEVDSRCGRDRMPGLSTAHACCCISSAGQIELYTGRSAPLGAMSVALLDEMARVG